MKPIRPDRVWLIDEVRGLSILLMVVYHTFYDLVAIFGVRIPAFSSPFVQALEVVFAGLFIFISGTASHYSHNNFKRGAICFALGLALTAGTALVMPDELIVFGILHMLGACMMLFPLFRSLLRRAPPLAGMLVCLGLFLLCFHLPEGYLGVRGALSVELPRAPYDWGFLAIFGFPGPGFFSADYFPLLPWIFCFLAGGFFGVLVKERRLPAWVYRPHLPPLALVGRHTLLVYVLHQPVVYGVLWVIFWLLRR